jgi:uncharacterized protein (DUF983 family)
MHCATRREPWRTVALGVTWQRQRAYGSMRAMTVMQRLGNAISRAARLRCPRCGEGALFRGAFSMLERCPHCHLTFEREPGYFVGAIYINYSATAILSIGGFLLLDAYVHPALTTQLIAWGAFGIAFPLWFFRYSKSCWLAIDHFVNPEDPSLHLLPRSRA